MDGQGTQRQPTASETQQIEANASEPRANGSETRANGSETQRTATPQEPAGQAGQEEGEGLTDRHGQPAIARGKYERDLAAKDEEIAELKSKLDELSRTEEGRKEQQERIAKLEAELAEAKVDHSLELAGCVNAKAARAILPDYDGDVSKLREACPYLFRSQPKGSTGLKPAGALTDHDGRVAKARAAAGLPNKKG